MKIYCPRCDVALVSRYLGAARFQLCPACQGVAISKPVLSSLSDPASVAALWSEAAARGEKSEANCPSCLRKMSLGEAPGQGHEIDLCERCHLVWFDQGEDRAVVEKARELAKVKAKVRTARPAWAQAPSAPGPEAGSARPAWAQASVPEAGASSGTAAAPSGPADDSYGLGTVALTLFGLPVEQDIGPLARTAWATRGIVAFTVLVSSWGFRHETAVLQDFAFRAGLPLAQALFTALSSFFFHAGVLHLLGNMYFLWVFGDDVENEVGHERMLLLLALSALMGCLFYLFGPGAKELPVIGASGGVSGVIAYYMIRFPDRRFRMMWFFRIFNVSALFVCGLFFVKDFIGAFLQMRGIGHVSHLSHLGGAVVGILMGLSVEKRS